MTPIVAPDGWSVQFRPGRPGEMGRTYSPPRREIVIWLRSDLTDRQLAATLEHEIMHAHDYDDFQGAGDRMRHQWSRMRGIPWRGQQAWFSCNGCTDYDVGAGDLAEATHACISPGWATFRSRLAGPPTPRQCQFVRSIVE